MLSIDYEVFPSPLPSPLGPHSFPTRSLLLSLSLYRPFPPLLLFPSLTLPPLHTPFLPPSAVLHFTFRTLTIENDCGRCFNIASMCGVGQVMTSPPEGTQVDWPAILTPRPSEFVEEVKPWIYPHRSRAPPHGWPQRDACNERIRTSPLRGCVLWRSGMCYLSGSVAKGVVSVRWRSAWQCGSALSETVRVRSRVKTDLLDELPRVAGNVASIRQMIEALNAV